MIATIDKALICDVKNGTYNNVAYKKLLVYDKGRLMSLTIKDDHIEDLCLDNISHYARIICSMSMFDGKSKFTVSSIEIL
ncbi:MAG TPA: hypothetical protein IAA41_04985 [Candidatus Eubacterium faecavium]|nr:hypothetical protein [Candidatus Eubacterium faecavium]